ncbi:RNA polymerase sigma factor [Pedobacter nyackensis]|uniref:RNA polymerase sigma-70 factor, ECF subfamily n=1 Tax=Pedobacter nyackensis TaxID=475255 RepID=A0A1W2B601_9SPHI|nr:sigma-70 family RNA polymerase sigma factor [Pedobacter nyackensis]SMC68356.1 RNA polymerase sigma-70 factor, ECF subfamily [Pedobacter nyackensis]
MSKPESNTSSEEDLLTQITEGNEKAFSVLYTTYWKYVYNSAYKRLQNCQDAENITQDIFLNIWNNRKTQKIENLKSFLYISVRNKVLDLIAKEKKYVELPEYIELFEQSSSSPAFQAIYKELLKEYKKQLEELPPQQKLIYELKFHENLSSDEIAEKLGLSVKTIRNHLGKAKIKLRASFFPIYVLALLHI